jgi:small nuclear ribonucleoprotein (snRNP)-like protein
MSIESLLKKYVRVDLVNGDFQTGTLNNVDSTYNMIHIKTNTLKDLFIPLTSVLTIQEHY